VVVLRRLIPAQSGGGGKWFPVTNYPEIDPGLQLEYLRAAHRHRREADRGRQERREGELQPLLRVDVHQRVRDINPNSIQTSGVQTWSFLGDLNNNGKADRNELGVLKSQFVAKSNLIDPNLKDPKNDEIMFAFQRELASNWSLNVDWIQRWFRDATTDQDCYGLPCNTVATTAYAPTRVVTDSGPDNLRGTGDDRTLTFYDVLPQYVGKDTFFHTNCGNNVSIDCVQRYKALEIASRQADVQPMAAAGLLRVVAARRRAAGYQHQQHHDAQRLRLHQPEQPPGPGRGTGTGARGQRSAAGLQAARQLPGTLGHQRRRELPGADRAADRPHADGSLSQGSRNIGVDPRGTYRASTLSLLSLRGDKAFRIGGTARASVIVELHNALNSSGGQNSYGALTQSYTSQAAFDAARLSTSYFGRTQEIVAPRVMKLGFKFDF
jgi:hypothetical protein